MKLILTVASVLKKCTGLPDARVADIVTQRTGSAIAVVCRLTHRYFLCRMIGFAHTANERKVTGMADTNIQTAYEEGFHDGYGHAIGEINNAAELTNDTFGEWLKEVKEQNGYTLAQMAQIAGVSYYSIQKYITEHMPPTLDSVMRITKAFGKRIIIM